MRRQPVARLASTTTRRQPAKVVPLRRGPADVLQELWLRDPLYARALLVLGADHLRELDERVAS